MPDMTIMGRKHSLPLPTSTSSVGPVPTVIPGFDPVFQEIGMVGTRTLWVVTALMALSSFIFYILASRVPLTKRTFHITTSLITTTSFITYMALATGTGTTWNHTILKTPHKHTPATEQFYFRQILWLRYLNWFLSTPLLLVNLAFLSGLPGAQLVLAIAADYVMLGAGVFATFVDAPAARWAWFTVSCVGYLALVYQVGLNGARAAGGKDGQTRRFFGSLSAVALLVWILFPITLAAGGIALKMSLDTEAILYAILDIFTQGILGYWLLVSHDSSPGLSLQVDGFWTNGIANEGSIRIGDNDGA